MSLRFECQSGCTRCCEQNGYVYLTEDDLARLASYLEMTPEAFERRYVYRTRHRMRLRTARRGPCVFLNETGCSVHAAKPLQCSSFPFWPELIDDEKEWFKTAAWCPGIGKGDLIQIDAVREIADEVRHAHRYYYEKG